MSACRHAKAGGGVAAALAGTQTFSAQRVPVAAGSGRGVALSQDFFFLPLRILFSIFFYFPSHALDFSHIFPQMCI